KLTNFAVNYPVTILMVVLGVLLLGVISYQKLGIDLFPDLNSPRIFVEIKAGERPPEEMEKLYVSNIEAIATRQSGVLDVSSISKTGSAQITVEYAWNKDMDEAFLDLQKALTAYSQNSQITELTITQHDPNTKPAMIVGMSHTSIKDMNELRKVAENYIRNELVRIEGVAQVELSGVETNEVRIDTDPYSLESYNLTVDQLSQKIQSYNRSISGGTITETGLQYVVKGVSLLQQKEDFENLIVGYKATVAGSTTAEKAPTFLKDVARVSFENKEPVNIVRINGERCIALAIYKETKYNTVKAVEEINKTLATIEKALPGYKFTVVSNQGTFIKSAVEEVKNTMYFGIILAVIILFLFLRRIGTTLIVSLSIPISIVATFNLMYFNGLSLNIMTLGGLALGAGMLVDNAIVVMENIFRNHENGMSAKDAAIVGTAEVGGAITAATLTHIVVFLPIIYMHGASGALFKDQAWTVAFSLLSSLFVAIFLIPMLYHRFFMNKKRASISIQKKTGYSDFLTGILPHRWNIIIASMVLFGLSLFLIPGIGSEFMPKSESKEFTISLKMKEGTTLIRTSEASASIEGMVRELLGDNLEVIYSRIGPSTGLSTSDQSIFEGDNTAELKVILKPNSNISSSKVVAAIAGWYAENPEMEVSFAQEETALQSILGNTEAPVVVEVRGDDLAVLDTLTHNVKRVVQDIPGMYNFTTNMDQGYPEVNVMVDRFRAGTYNLAVTDIVTQLTAKLTGQTVGQFDKNGELRDITIHLPKLGFSELGDVIIRNGTQVIRLGEVATLKQAMAPKEIYHSNQIRVGKVMAELQKGASLDKISTEIQTKISAINLPTDYRFKIAGEEQKRQESWVNLRFALLLSIALVYMVLAAKFESLIHPFVILLSIPFAIVGTIILFYILGQTFNMMALIGIIMLGGIAVNDSIILVDRINQLRELGMEKRAAIAQAGQQRLRPILMMSIITIFALVPLTLGFGDSAALRAPMALAVIGGMVTSTLLTLLVIPCVYDLLTSNKPIEQDI
ncbi:MAG: efflux RND transporter permease subunit, partial [Prolixibacteraceae bacterium]|nr:efflux RND transporter permease subunit [Prolixibacteraceae bacterium]